MSRLGKPRAKTQRGGYERFARPPTPIPEHVEREETPPPRDPAEAIARLWAGRHDGERLDRLERKIDDYTQTVARSHAVAEGAWGAVKELMPKLDQLLQGQGRAEAVGDAVAAIDTKLDTFSERFAAIEQEQARAAVRFEEHDKRDHEMSETVASIDTRVSHLEQRNTEQDAGDKRELALARRRRRLFQTLIGAVSTGVGWLLGFFT